MINTEPCPASPLSAECRFPKSPIVRAHAMRSHIIVIVIAHSHLVILISSFHKDKSGAVVRDLPDL